MSFSPLFQHDCNQCHFLGTISYSCDNTGNIAIQNDDKKNCKPKRMITADLYCCQSNKDTQKDASIIVRFSGQGPDYISAPPETIKDIYLTQTVSQLVSRTPALNCAYWLAVSKGLINHNQ